MKNNHILEGKIEKLGMFLSFGPNYPFGIYQFSNIEYYLFICKITGQNEINFMARSYIIYCDDKNNYIYDIVTGQRINKNKLDEELQIDKFSFFQGYWINN